MRLRRIALLIASALLAWACGPPTPEVESPEAATPSTPAALSVPASPEALAPIPPGRIHHSPIAGSWYPSDPDALHALLAAALAQAPESPQVAPDDMVGLIVPHAGYAYSAPVAAVAYRLLAARRRPTRIIVLGPSHSVAFRGVSIADADAYETPIGLARLDLGTVSRLRECPLVVENEAAHRREHSVDIQMPWLLQVYDSNPPPVVPIVVGDLAEDDFTPLAEALRGVMDDNTVLIVSTDFTHHGPNYGYTVFPLDEHLEENLMRLAAAAVEAIETGSRAAFEGHLARTGDTICGHRAISLALDLLGSDTWVATLAHDTSGAQTGDFTNSVTYIALAMCRLGDADTPTLTPAEQATLLAIARETLQDLLTEGAVRNPMADGAHEMTPALRRPSGAFVTLNREGHLRGCIGDIFPRRPLALAVMANAINAAFNDPRFPPVAAQELPAIDVEVSVLSRPRPVESWEQIEIGTHGVLMTQGNHRAVFLPQVAPEQGWGLEETLDNLAIKAGLPPEAWCDPSTSFEVFTAQVFAEGNHPAAAAEPSGAAR